MNNTNIMEMDDTNTLTAKEVDDLLNGSPNHGQSQNSSPSVATKVAKEAKMFETDSSNYDQKSDEEAFDATLDAKIASLERENLELLELAAKTMPRIRTNPSAKSNFNNPTTDEPSSVASDGADPWIPVAGSSRGISREGDTKMTPGAGRKAPGAESDSKSSYAEKTKLQGKPREMVAHMLYVYATKFRKAPLAISDWKVIDEHLIDGLIDDSNTIHIAKSGYDSTYRCGYIACRDIDSARWCQRLVSRVVNELGVGYRAWARGEKPDGQLCRLFLPARFHKLSDQMALAQLHKYNPSLTNGALTIKSSEQVQGGRAIFIEVDSDSYNLIKRRDHKLAFLAMDVDCQVAPPSPQRRAMHVGLAAKVPGIVRLTSPPHKAASIVPLAKAANLPEAPSIKNPVPNQVKRPSFKDVTVPLRDPRLEKIRLLEVQLASLQQQQSSQAAPLSENDSMVESEGKKRRRNRGSRSKNRKTTIPNPDE